MLKAYDSLVNALAWLAGALLFAMMATITIDVVLRNIGTQGSAHFFTFTEYALFLVPLLGSPWLVRDKGHVFVEILTMSLPEKLRHRLSMYTCLVCVAICLVLAFYGGQVAWDDFQLSAKDVRSLDMPRWMVVMWIPLAFSLMAVEFARFLWRRENFLAPMADIA